MVRSVQQSRSRRRKDLLMRAAGQLLIEQGPSGVTFRNVAVQAGLPEGTASYYFKNRTSLYQHAVQAAEDIRVAAADKIAQECPVVERTAEETVHLLIQLLYAPRIEDGFVHRRLEPMLHAQAQPVLSEIMHQHRLRLLEAGAVVLDKSGFGKIAPSDIELLLQAIEGTLLYTSHFDGDDVLWATAQKVSRWLELLKNASV